MTAVTIDDQKIIDDYLQNHEVKKLHIGCGPHYLEGWLNTDIERQVPQVIFLDATNPYPFQSNQFDYIFSEHMIEHVTYTGGSKMLQECFRILKPGGKLRLSTPDIQFLIALYQDNLSPVQQNFIKNSFDQWIADSPDYQEAPKYEKALVINNYMRAWGHQCIYDERVLRYLLETTGFVQISRFNVCESQDSALQNLENIERQPPGLIALESLVLECMKP